MNGSVSPNELAAPGVECRQLVVEEVFPDGQMGLSQDQLAYIGNMANRVGFSVLEARADLGKMVFRIKLKIPMSDPYFLALLGGPDGSNP